MKLSSSLLYWTYFIYLVMSWKIDKMDAQVFELEISTIHLCFHLVLFVAKIG